MRNLVLFHDDLDGNVAAYLLSILRALKLDETVYIPWVYGEKLPTDKMIGSAAYCYFLDLQLDPEIWQRYDKLCVDCNEIFDHHKGCPKDLEWTRVNWSERLSTTKQVWALLKPMTEPRIATGLQRLVDIVDGLDMGRAGDNIDFGSAVLEAAVMGIPRWQGQARRFAAIEGQAQNLAASIHGVMACGQQIHKWKMGEVNRLIDSACVVEFEGHHMPVVNTQSLVKEVLDHLSIVKADMVACWWRQNSLFEVRLRAVSGNIDVVEIAQRYGGGGHGRTAGFRMSGLPPWTEVPDGKCKKD
jgi:oligoribonuclease NrnB/cAMP/cGMP phosphodiesterase (DHH superfamily)